MKNLPLAMKVDRLLENIFLEWSSILLTLVRGIAIIKLIKPLP
jgi:hypothetical protein